MNVYATLDVVMDAQLCGQRVDKIDMLSFQKLRVYQRSIEFLGIELLEGIVAMLKKMT